MHRTDDAQTPRPEARDSLEVIGDGRDVEAIVEALLAGRSVVAGGPLGAGKSFLLQRVVESLEAQSISPVAIRGAAAMRALPFGALEAAGDARAEALRDSALTAESTVLIIDDAQELDEASTAAILRSVYARSAPALFALTEPRLHGLGGAGAATEAINELWLRGVADRIDIGALKPDESSRLLDIFSDHQPLDSVTRAAIIWQADGSRMLLRTLTEAAFDALASGRDPLSAIDDIPPHSKLATGLHGHIREFDDQSRRALILVDRVNGIGLGDAARFVPIEALDSLRAIGLIHDDGSVHHRLSANQAIARAAERAIGPTGSQAVVCEALNRLLADRGRWWSAPLAGIQAERWLRMASGPAAIDVPPELVERILVDAARGANDRGNATLAAAYAEWGAEDLDSPALALEHAHAYALLGHPCDALVPRDGLDAEGRRRAHQITVSLEAQEIQSGALTALGRAETDSPGPADWDRSLNDARLALQDLRIADCRDAARKSRSNVSGARAIDVITADLFLAIAAAYQGQLVDMHGHLASAERLFRAAGSDAGDISERLMARCMDLAARAIIGSEDSATAHLLEAETNDAVRRGGLSLAVAGFAHALANARRGRALDALRELDAALQRAPVAVSSGNSVVQLDTAYALAASGHTNEARVVFSAIDAPRVPSLLYRHAELATLATILASEQDLDGARSVAEQARELISDSDAFAIRVRDLHRLVVLRHPHAAAALSELRELTADSDGPIMRTLLVSAEQADRDDSQDPATVLAHLRLAISPASPGGSQVRFGRGTRPWTIAQPTQPNVALTPREKEIATLVHEGLSNREIAATLFLSVRTVESHIYQARVKVGARTRRELGLVVWRAANRRGQTGLTVPS